MEDQDNILEIKIQIEDQHAQIKNTKDQKSEKNIQNNCETDIASRTDLKTNLEKESIPSSGSIITLISQENMAKQSQLSLSPELESQSNKIIKEHHNTSPINTSSNTSFNYLGSGQRLGQGTVNIQWPHAESILDKSDLKTDQVDAKNRYEEFLSNQFDFEHQFQVPKPLPYKPITIPTNEFETSKQEEIKPDIKPEIKKQTENVKVEDKQIDHEDRKFEEKPAHSLAMHQGYDEDSQTVDDDKQLVNKDKLKIDKDKQAVDKDDQESKQVIATQTLPQLSSDDNLKSSLNISEIPDTSLITKSEIINGSIEARKDSFIPKIEAIQLVPKVEAHPRLNLLPQNIQEVISDLTSNANDIQTTAKTNNPATLNVKQKYLFLTRPQENEFEKEFRSKMEQILKIRAIFKIPMMISKNYAKKNLLVINSALKNARKSVVPIGYYNSKICSCGQAIHVATECKLAVKKIEKCGSKLWKKFKGTSAKLKVLKNNHWSYEIQAEHSKNIFGIPNRDLQVPSTLTYSYNVERKIQLEICPTTATDMTAYSVILFGNYDNPHDDMIWKCDLNSEMSSSFLFRLFGGLPTSPKVPDQPTLISYREHIYIIGGKATITPEDSFWGTLKHTFYKFSFFKEPKRIEISKPTRQCFKYNPSHKTYERFEDMNFARHHHATILFNGKIFAFGGLDENEVAICDNEAYNLGQNSWEVESPSKVPMFGMAVSEFLSSIWIIGGFTVDAEGNERLLDTVYRYNLDKSAGADGRYVNQMKFPYPIAFGTAIEHNKCLYVIGGQIGLPRKHPELKLTNQVWLYDYKEQKWIEVYKLSSPRKCVGAFSMGNRLYVYGGIDTKGHKSLSNECMVNDARGWLKDMMLPVAVSSHHVTSIKTETLRGISQAKLRL